MRVTRRTKRGWGRSIGCCIHFAFVDELSTFKLPSCICSLRRFVCDRLEAFRVTGCMSRENTVHLPAFRTFSISNISKIVFQLLQHSLIISKETTSHGPNGSSSSTLPPALRHLSTEFQYVTKYLKKTVGKNYDMLSPAIL